MGLVLLFARQGTTVVIGGQASLSLTLGVMTQSRLASAAGGQVVLPLQLSATTQGSVTKPGVPPSLTPQRLYPDVTYQVAFTATPLTRDPAFTDVSSRIRGITSQRGRSYEFDREEAGTLGAVLSNRDAALSPANTSSPYNPIRSTRGVRAFLSWEESYPLFRGISEGFPQTYRSLGKDSLVQLRANDLFYALNNSRFVPGSTTLTAALAVVTADGSETISVVSTALPMPQTVPFEITIDSETMTVTAISNATQYLASRTLVGTAAHAIDTTVSTLVVSFGEESSGARIQNVLERVGFDSGWYDLDAGQSLITPSEDLASVAPLEHINLIAEAEFGRFFVSRDGKFTFRDRHSVIVDYLTPVLTFGTDMSEVPFSLAGELEHSEDKLYNRARITIQGGAYDGTVVDISDADSIADHFERVFEKTYPYADVNDADSAARFVLARNAEARLRLPGIVVKPAVNPGTLWPLVLARELGERVRFIYQPEAGGDEIDKQLIIEGISHDIAPMAHAVTFQCTEVDSTQYWILGLAGYSELGETTRVGF